MEVTVYSTPTCPWCKKTKEFLKDNDIDFEEKNVAEEEEARDEMADKSGQMGVPVIIIKKGKEGEEEEEIIIGFDKNKLEEALGLGEKE